FGDPQWTQTGGCGTAPLPTDSWSACPSSASVPFLSVHPYKPAWLCDKSSIFDPYGGASCTDEKSRVVCLLSTFVRSYAWKLGEWSRRGGCQDSEGQYASHWGWRSTLLYPLPWGNPCGCTVSEMIPNSPSIRASWRCVSGLP